MATYTLASVLVVLRTRTFLFLPSYFNFKGSGYQKKVYFVLCTFQLMSLL